MPENIQETKVLNTDKSNMKYADRDKWTGSPGSTAEEKLGLMHHRTVLSW